MWVWILSRLAGGGQSGRPPHSPGERWDPGRSGRCCTRRNPPITYMSWWVRRLPVSVCPARPSRSPQGPSPLSFGRQAG